MTQQLESSTTDPAVIDALEQEFPTGLMTGRMFEQLHKRVHETEEFKLIADRKLDWARYQQLWRHVKSGTVWVMDYPFEKSQGRFILKEKHPTAKFYDDWTFGTK